MSDRDSIVAYLNQQAERAKARAAACLAEFEGAEFTAIARAMRVAASDIRAGLDVPDVPA